MWIPKIFKKQSFRESKDKLYLYKDIDTGLIGYLNSYKIFQNILGLSENIINALNGSNNASETNVFVTQEDLDLVNGGVSLIFVDLTTTNALPTNTYNNGIAGVGATITINANGALPDIDGVVVEEEMLILVKNEIDKIKNGIYEVTTLGNGITQAVLTRLSNYDETAEIYPSRITVLEGVINKNVEFSQKIENPIIGTNNIIFEKLNNIQGQALTNLYLADTTTSATLGIAYTYISGTIDLDRPGIYATITANANAVFPTINGVAPFNGMIILLKDETNSEYNGLYILAKKGSVSSKWKLVRNYFYDSNTIPKKLIAVSHSDSTLYGTFYACDNTSILDTNVGIDPITFSEISGGTTNTNFANANLEFTANRTHDADNYTLTINDVGTVTYKSVHAGTSSLIFNYKDSNDVSRASLSAYGLLQITPEANGLTGVNFRQSDSIRNGIQAVDETQILLQGVSYLNLTAFNGDLTVKTEYAGDVIIKSNNTERMRIKNNGNINISSLSTYADNAAAVTGLGGTGYLYIRTGHGLDITT